MKFISILNRIMQILINLSDQIPLEKKLLFVI